MPNLSTQIQKVYGKQFLIEYGKRYTILDYVDLQIANPLISAKGDTIEFLRFGDESVNKNRITDWGVEAQFSPNLTYDTPPDAIQQLKIDRTAWWTRMFHDNKMSIYESGVIEQISSLAARKVRDETEADVLYDMYLKSQPAASTAVGTPSTSGTTLTAGAGTPFTTASVGCLVVNADTDEAKTIVSFSSSTEVELDSAPAAPWSGGQDVAVAEAHTMDFSSPTNVKNFFRDLKTKMDEADLPFENRFICVSHRMFNWLSSIDEFTNELYVGNDRVIRTGEVGQLFGFNVFASNLHFSGGDVQRGVAGVMSPIAPPYAVYVKKSFQIEELRDKDQFASYLRGHMLWGSGSVGKVLSASTDGTTLADGLLNAASYKAHLGLFSVNGTGL